MSRRPRSRMLLAGVLLAPVCLGGPATAGEVYLFREQAPSASELADIMFPKQGQRTRSLRTRGIRFTDPATEQPAAAPPPPATVAAPPPPPQETTATAAAATSATDVPAAKGASVGFNINFALGSAELLRDSLPNLDAVGRMLRDERPDAKIEIAGHADASGPERLNRQLSEQRALSVARYLYESWGVAPERMRIVGYGESQPLPGTNPYDGVNRRVEFRPVE